MSGKRGVYALSDNLPIAAGGTIQLPLNQHKNLRGPGRFRHAHVRKLFLTLFSVTVAAFAADTAIDTPFLAGLVSEIGVDAGSDSPMGARNGGTLIRPQSMYLALTALTRMTDAPAINFGAASDSRFVNEVSGLNPDPKNIAQSSVRQVTKRLKGPMHTQGPWGEYAALAAITSQDITFTLAIGERRGEPDGKNLIPLAWLNGGGGACGCSSSQGVVKLSVPTTVSGLGVTYTSAQVFAELEFLDKVNIPLQPWINTFQVTTPVIQLDSGISGFRALCEDLTAGNAMQLPDMVGVSQRRLSVGGWQPYEPQYPSARKAYIALWSGNGCPAEHEAERDPDATADTYNGTNGKARFSNPWVPILWHGGLSSDAPDFGDGECEAVTFELVNATNAVNRRVLSGVWLPMTADYVSRAMKFAGEPNSPPDVKTPMGLAPSAVARGLVTGVPMTVRKNVTVPG